MGENPFTKQMKVSAKVPTAKTSTDKKTVTEPELTAKEKLKDMYSEDDLKPVVTLSVKLPKAVRRAIQSQCSQQDVKLATEAKKWILERFELPEGFTAEVILEDGRVKK